MKKNVAYLFGAGASANALPVVKYFNARLELFLKFLELKNQSENFSKIIQDTSFILNESKNHSTIDTVAKKFFHSYSTKSIQLEQLKRVLMMFFLYEQHIDDVIIKDPNWGNEDDILVEEREKTGNKNGKIDKRYDSFIASLLKPIENNFVFPDEVGIITWNYDCQFELALKQFTNQTMYDLQKLLNAYPFFSPTAEKPYWDKINTQKFKILHLNGQAHNFYKEGIEKPPMSFFDSQDNIENILEKALQFMDSKNLTFSWEANSKEDLRYEEMTTVIDNSILLVNRSKVLVIIGYSFPFFNREVDKTLFRNKSFDKIYIQDSNSKNIKDLFINVFTPKINSDNVVAYEDTEHFLLPPELDTDFTEPMNLSGLFN